MPTDSDDEFKAAISSGIKPTTNGVVRTLKIDNSESQRMDRKALWIWGKIMEIEREGYLDLDPEWFYRK